MYRPPSSPTDSTLKYGVDENPPDGLSWLLALIEMRQQTADSPNDKLHMEIVTGGESVELSIGVAPLHDDIKDLIDASQSVKPLSMSKLPFQILGELDKQPSSWSICKSHS